MNQEKIKALAEQAGYLPDMFGVGHWDMPEFKRFAELIVNECVKYLKTTDFSEIVGNQNDVAVTAAEDLQNLFGIE